eukprot:jgi/Chlat1/1945/Chrsp153S02250
MATCMLARRVSWTSCTFSAFPAADLALGWRHRRNYIFEIWGQQRGAQLGKQLALLLRHSAISACIATNYYGCLGW